MAAEGTTTLNLMVKCLSAVSVVIVICLASLLYVRRTYYFNPLTFRRDAVTPYAWTEYKNPVELDLVYQPKDGSMYRYTTDDRREIDYVLKQLKVAELKNIQFPSVMGQTIIQLRDPVSEESYLVASVPSGNKFILLFDKQAVTLMSGLVQYMDDKRMDANRVN